MQLIVNGESVTCTAGASLLDVVRQLGLAPEKLVVERNGEIVSAEALATLILGEGDTLELLQFVGGG